MKKVANVVVVVLAGLVLGGCVGSTQGLAKGVLESVGATAVHAVVPNTNTVPVPLQINNPHMEEGQRLAQESMNGFNSKWGVGLGVLKALTK